MKNTRHFCATIALIIALTGSAFAGEMSTGRTPPLPAPIPGVIVVAPPPPPSSTTPGKMGTGVTSTDSTTDGATTAGSLTDTLLSLLQSIWGLI